VRLGTVVLLAFLLAAPGCIDLGGLFRPGYHAFVTPLNTGPSAWNRDGTFRVRTTEAGVAVHIEAKQAATGRTIGADGTSKAELDIPDGTWTVAYTLGGYDWGSYAPVRVDATPPDIGGLAPVLLSPTGDATVGAGATVTGASAVTVRDLDTGEVLGNALPLHLTGLATGLRILEVEARDEAGNWANATVQVRVGSTDTLPDGRYTFGVVARYNNAVRIWDIRHLDTYPSPAAAEAAVTAATGAGYLGEGYGVTPHAAAVEQVVQDAVRPGATTGETALQLYEWMFGHLTYDNARLSSNATDLLTPTQTLARGGGVCRDLAALYVSLLRGAGVPARLVTGYVAGGVNDFHAWVEFYGAPDSAPSPWVPVDVSPLSGDPSQLDVTVLSAFAIHLPDYLMLRQLPPSAEVAGWESAGALSYQWPKDRPAPTVAFQSHVTATRTQDGTLCLNLKTWLRTPATEPSSCPAGASHVQNQFTLATERVMDYGVQVTGASRGTSVNAALSYPFSDPQGQDFVTYEFYGASLQRHADTGKAETTKDY
jgi:transglutaminase-like putative cysteine protease